MLWVSLWRCKISYMHNCTLSVIGRFFTCGTVQTSHVVYSLPLTQRFLKVKFITNIILEKVEFECVEMESVVIWTYYLSSISQICFHYIKNSKLCSKIKLFKIICRDRFFWAPNGTRLSARCHFTGPKKLENSRAQPPPTSPRNGYARIQNIMHGAV